MDTKVEAMQDSRVKVTVNVDAKDIDARIKKTYRDFAHKYSFPGFRKGKAPRPIIDNALGAEAVRATVTDEVINELYPLAIDENDLFPLGKPNFPEETGLVSEGSSFSFDVELEVKPELKLSSYDPVDIEMPAEGASDEEINEQIDALRKHYADYEDAADDASVQEGSFLDIALSASDDAGEQIAAMASKSRLYGLGTGLFPAAFDAELVGMKKGDKKSFSIDLPAEPTILTQPLVGKTSKIAFEVEVKSVKNKVIPEVTDEWVKETLDFESSDFLRERIRESIVQQKAEVLPRIKETRCLNVLAERLEGEVPEAMVEEAEANLLQDFFRQLQGQGQTFDIYLAQQGITSEQFKEEIKVQAKDMTKQDLALDAWAKHYKMEVSDEDVTAEFEKASSKDSKALEDEWRSSGRLHTLRNGIRRTNAATDVMAKAVVSEIEPASQDEKKDQKDAAKKSGAKKSSKKSSDKKDAGKKDTDAAKDQKKPAKKVKKATDDKEHKVSEKKPHNGKK